MPSVLIADDSGVARAMLSDILRRDGDFHLVGQARNGKEAVELAVRHKPDVILMDIWMPVMDGFEATATIMDVSPTPIVIVTSIDFSAHSDVPYKALEAGAVKLLNKPTNVGTAEFTRQADELVRTVKLMADVKVVTRRRRKSVPPRSKAPRLPQAPEVIAVGASSGGPQALATILKALPGSLPVPILLVQHITAGFTAGLVKWLDELSALQVRPAVAQKEIVPGEVIVAPDGQHLGVSAARRVMVSDSPPLEGHRPSATFLFRSVAAAYGPGSLAVILSGMGQDGTDGLVEVKTAGGYVIAQDPRSCVVGSMPATAIERGVVDEVLPLEAIAPALVAAARQATPSG